jgi:hypothetical protein
MKMPVARHDPGKFPFLPLLLTMVSKASTESHIGNRSVTFCGTQKKGAAFHEKSRASQQRLERWTYRNTGSGHFVNPDLVLVVLHVQGDLSGCYDRIGGIVCGRSREGLILAIALLGA